MYLSTGQIKKILTIFNKTAGKIGEIFLKISFKIKYKINLKNL